MMRRSCGRLRVIGFLSALLVGLAVLTVSPAQARPLSSTTPHASATTGGGDAVTKTKDVTRSYYPRGQLTPKTVSDDVSVSVDKHTNLQSRERLTVSWTGAHPTGGRVGNPYGESGLDQEYPMVVLECRGVDSASVPAARQISPDTCFTNTYQERSVSDDASRAIWRDDAYASNADKQQFSGEDESKLPDSCPPRQDSTAYHYTPFNAVDGTVYTACDSNHLPPEAAVGSVDPPNEAFAYTAPDGKGSIQFEARTETENASLGCSHTVACSLVVIPIMGLSCADTQAACNQTGAYAPGASNDGTTGAQQAVSGQLWWSASNWRNRISIPLQFALPASTCTLLGQGPAVPFYGSELLSQAALQWAPSYCLNKHRFNWQSNTMADDAAFDLMLNGTSDAAEVSGKAVDDTKQIGYAPTAASGFGIAFDIDDQSTGNQITSLKLNARLLAKLMTESYPADEIGSHRPGLSDNPLSLQTDPEFLRLNPDAALPEGRVPSQAAATLLQLSTGSGITEQLTDYIAHDPQAMAFIHGKADPWGMKVNPAYKDIQLPVSTWPLLDTWAPKNTGNSCLDDNVTPYLPKIAAPVSNLRLIAQALLFNWPLVQTACDRDPNSGIYKLGRGPRQNIGQRFMLGLVTLGDAQRFGLSVASLQAASGHYVTPTTRSLSSAVSMGTEHGVKPATIDQADIRRSSSAYPGTMVVYTAAMTGPLKTYQDGSLTNTVPGLDATQADNVSQFIRVSSTEGQKLGRGNGQLPAGYLSITKSGPTAPLYEQAQKVAAMVAAQKPVVVKTGQAPKDPPTTSPDSTPPNGPGTTPPTDATAPDDTTPLTSPSNTDPSTGPTTAPSEAPNTVATSAPLATTGDLSSSWAGRLLLLLLLAGLLAGVGATAGRVVLRRRGLK